MIEIAAVPLSLSEGPSVEVSQQCGLQLGQLYEVDGRIGRLTYSPADEVILFETGGSALRALKAALRPRKT